MKYEDFYWEYRLSVFLNKIEFDIVRDLYVQLKEMRNLREERK